MFLAISIVKVKKMFNCCWFHLLKFTILLTQVSSKIKEYSPQVVDSPSSILVDMENLRVKSNELCELLDEKKKLVEIKMQDRKKMEDIVVKVQLLLNELKDVLKLIDQHRLVCICSYFNKIPTSLVQ